MTTPEQLTHPDHIAGYDYGSADLRRSPVALPELAELEAAAGLTDADTPWLLRAGELVSPDAAHLVDDCDPRPDVDAMTAAVTKSVMLHVTLWTREYADHPHQW